MTVAEAAAILGLPKNRVRILAKAGDVVARRADRNQWWLDPRSVRALAARLAFVAPTGYVSMEQAAEILGVGTERVRRQLQVGGLRGLKDRRGRWAAVLVASLGSGHCVRCDMLTDTPPLCDMCRADVKCADRPHGSMIGVGQGRLKL